MRAQKTRSAPKWCPECSSQNLGGMTNVVENGGNSMLCHDCGLWIRIYPSTEEEADAELVASLTVCPHCTTVNEIRIEGGEEWCSGCGLDPSIQDYSSPALSHLWKKGSGIQGFMQRALPMVAQDHGMGQFLRTMCGPHCSFADACPQAIGNFIVCYREEYPTAKDCEDMSKKKSKKARKESRQERRAQMEAIKKAKQKALIMCADSGWFEKVMYGNTPYPQQVGDTGSGSGT